MASLLSPRRLRSKVSLRATEPRDEPTVALPQTSVAPPLVWPALAAAGGLLTALVGWVLTAGVTVVGWLGAEVGTAAGGLGGALAFGTRWWLLSGGAGTRLGDLGVTLVPWGATAVWAVMLASVTAYAARQARNANQPVTGQTAAGLAALAALGYLAPVAVVALLLGGLVLAPQALAVGAAVAGASLFGACRGLGYDPTRILPVWTRQLPRALLASQLVLLGWGAVVLGTGLVLHSDRARQLIEALQAGIVGNLALLVAELSFVPNGLVWASSYAVGAGFTIGDGSVVAPAATTLGLLPGIPLFAALPSAGPGGPFGLLWMAGAVLAGALAGWVILTHGRPDSVLQMIGKSGLAGVLSAATFVLLAWASGGDLGNNRLADLGPLLVPLIWRSAATVAGGGLLVGAVLGLRELHRRRSR